MPPSSHSSLAALRRRVLVAASFAIAASVVGAEARAADVQQCLAASEKGQRARASGRLREARDAFQTCGEAACPAIVRNDCTRWQAEIVSSLPSLVFGARDAKGHDLFDVAVSIDGEPVAKKLDGKAVPIDPGPHTFRFEAAGYAPVTEKALVKEGEKARIIDVTLTEAAPAPAPAPTAAPAPRPIEATPSQKVEGAWNAPKPRGGHTVYPWIVVGVGVAGIAAGVVVVVTSPTRPDNCSKASQTCKRLPGESDEDFARDQDRAGQADSRPTLGWIIAGAGAVVAAGGLVWHFLEPTGEGKRGTRVTPWTSGAASGVTFVAPF
jgi:hypothetical protein